MSDATTHVLALVALFLLWGLAGHFDAVDDRSEDSSAPAQSLTSIERKPAAPLLRMVCMAEEDLAPSGPSKARRTSQPQLVSLSVQPDGEEHPSAAVLRCFVDND